MCQDPEARGSMGPTHGTRRNSVRTEGRDPTRLRAPSPRSLQGASPQASRSQGPSGCPSPGGHMLQHIWALWLKYSLCPHLLPGSRA